MDAAIPIAAPGHRPRRRLSGLVETLTTQPGVLLVKGAPGAGKTSALADWARSLPDSRRVTWLTLDDPDPAPGSAWKSILSALVRTGLPTEVSTPAGVASVLDRMPEPLTLIIDDFHLADPCTEQHLAHLATHLRQGRILIATRRTTQLESAWHTVQVRVTTISADQLAFTVDETAQLATAAEVTVDPAALHAATGGHPLLTRLVLATPGTAAPFDDAARIAADWVGTLIEPEHLLFALHAAQCLVLDDQLAAEITGLDRPADVLAEFARQGLGIRDPLGDFRFHPVIGSALRHHAGSTLSSGTLRRTLLHATDHLARYPRHALPALRLMVITGRGQEIWPHAAGHLAELLDDATSLQHLVDELPDDLVARDGTIGAIAALVRSRREPSPSVGLLDTAALALDELRSRPPSVEPDEAFFRELAVLTLLRAVRRYDAAATSAHRLFHMITALDPATRRRISGAVHVALLQCATTHGLTAQLDEAAGVLVAASGDQHPQRRRQRLTQEAFVHAMRGTVGAAAHILDAELPQPPHAPEWVARYTIARAAVLLEAGDVASARDALHALESSLGSTEEWPYALIVTARIHIADDPGEGIEDVDRLLQLHGRRPISRGVRDRLDSALADLALAAGDVRRARRLVDRRQEGDIALRLSAARIALIAGDHEAVQDLRRLISHDAIEPRLRAQAFLLLAVHLHRAGSRDSANDAVRRALRITRASGIDLIHSLVPGSELEAIAIAAGVQPPGRRDGADPLEEVLTPVDLTTRERILLQRLTTSASLRDIAASEFVALSTVKSQVASIYRKLNASTRHEAVDAAHRRGLIGH